MQYRTNGWDIMELYKYIRLLLDIYILLKVPNNFMIKDNLRDVYTYFIISQIIGMEISSKQANNFVTDMLNYKDPNIVYNYKTVLRRMGWFIKNSNKKYVPIQTFNYTADNLTLEKTYKFTIKYTKKEDYNFIDTKKKTTK
jgi:hypothetical protein